ncbi:MAG: hypothetical protein M1827_000448 [Pycnora praestabilis]|nr:MAG: hypothetical protein M1827_000448 [Pycnora praestabilis]
MFQPLPGRDGQPTDKKSQVGQRSTTKTSKESAKVSGKVTKARSIIKHVLAPKGHAISAFLPLYSDRVFTRVRRGTNTPIYKQRASVMFGQQSVSERQDTYQAAHFVHGVDVRDFAEPSATAVRQGCASVLTESVIETSDLSLTQQNPDSPISVSIPWKLKIAEGEGPVPRVCFHKSPNMILTEWPLATRLRHKKGCLHLRDLSGCTLVKTLDTTEETKADIDDDFEESTYHSSPLEKEREVPEDTNCRRCFLKYNDSSCNGDNWEDLDQCAPHVYDEDETIGMNLHEHMRATARKEHIDVVDKLTNDHLDMVKVFQDQVTQAYKQKATEVGKIAAVQKLARREKERRIEQQTAFKEVNGNLIKEKEKSAKLHAAYEEAITDLKEEKKRYAEQQARNEELKIDPVEEKEKCQAQQKAYEEIEAVLIMEKKEHAAQQVSYEGLMAELVKEKTLRVQADSNAATLRQQLITDDQYHQNNKIEHDELLKDTRATNDFLFDRARDLAVQKQEAMDFAETSKAEVEGLEVEVAKVKLEVKNLKATIESQQKNIDHNKWVEKHYQVKNDDLLQQNKGLADALDGAEKMRDRVIAYNGKLWSQKHQQRKMWKKLLNERNQHRKEYNGILDKLAMVETEDELANGLALYLAGVINQNEMLLALYQKKETEVHQAELDKQIVDADNETLLTKVAQKDAEIDAVHKMELINAGTRAEAAEESQELYDQDLTAKDQAFSKCKKALDDANEQIVAFSARSATSNAQHTIEWLRTEVDNFRSAWETAETSLQQRSAEYRQLKDAYELYEVHAEYVWGHDAVDRIRQELDESNRIGNEYRTQLEALKADQVEANGQDVLFREEMVAKNDVKTKVIEDLDKRLVKSDLKVLELEQELEEVKTGRSEQSERELKGEKYGMLTPPKSRPASPSSPGSTGSDSTIRPTAPSADKLKTKIVDLEADLLKAYGLNDGLWDHAQIVQRKLDYIQPQPLPIRRPNAGIACPDLWEQIVDIGRGEKEEITLLQLVRRFQEDIRLKQEEIQGLQELVSGGVDLGIRAQYEAQNAELEILRYRNEQLLHLVNGRESATDNGGAEGVGEEEEASGDAGDAEDAEEPGENVDGGVDLTDDPTDEFF